MDTRSFLLILNDTKLEKQLSSRYGSGMIIRDFSYKIMRSLSVVGGKSIILNV